MITYCISFVVAMQCMKDREARSEPPGSLCEPSEKPRNSPLLFVQPILPWVHELVPCFTICSAELKIQASLNDLTSCIARLSHEWKAELSFFMPPASNSFYAYFCEGGGMGWGGGVGNPSLLHLHSVTLEISPTRVARVIY